MKVHWFKVRSKTD